MKMTACDRRGGWMLLAAMGAAGLAGCSSTPEPLQPGDINGRFIATISDVDMRATTIATAQLGERDDDAVDLLTVFPLPIQEPSTPFAQIPVSSSLIGPPAALAASPDGRTLFVVESRGTASEEGETFADLEGGRWLTAVDVSAPESPQIIDRVDVGPNPMAVAVHPYGDLVAVVRRSDSEQIMIATFDGISLGSSFVWSLIGLDDDSAEPSAIAWDPTGRFLAVTLPTRDEVMFYEFSRDVGEDAMALAPFGSPVGVGRYPYSGRFTAGGRFFITTDLQWGADVPGFNIGAPEGRLTVIRLSDESPSDADAGLIEHEVVGTATVGISPEGIAISPDGRFVVTANLRQSFLPADDPRRTADGMGGSLSLLRFDPSSGRLTAVAEYPVQGMPEGLAFDASGRHVVVTQFRSMDPEAEDGELSFWRLDPKGPSLKEADFRLGVGQGPHDVIVVP